MKRITCLLAATMIAATGAPVLVFPGEEEEVEREEPDHTLAVERSGNKTISEREFSIAE